MLTIPWTSSGDTLTVYLRGVPHTVDQTHPNFKAVYEGLKARTLTVEEATKLVSVKRYIQSLNIGFVTVAADAILYKGEPVHSALTQKMLEIVAAGFDVEPWARFMDNLYKNPSRQSIEELYLWIEKAQMPITEDGHFLAYKKVRDDFLSYHDGKTKNDIGTWVVMDRNRVDDRRDNTCSYGLHFCSWTYLPQYYGSSGKVVVLKINPADVVSIPSDYDNAKGRAFRYFVVEEVAQDKVQFAFSGRPIVETAGAGAGFDEDGTEEEDLYEAWQEAVSQGETKLGYTDWLRD